MSSSGPPRAFLLLKEIRRLGYNTFRRGSIYFSNLERLLKGFLAMKSAVRCKLCKTCGTYRLTVRFRKKQKYARLRQALGYRMYVPKFEVKLPYEKFRDQVFARKYNR